MSARLALAAGVVVVFIGAPSGAGANGCAGIGVLAAGQREIAMVDVDQDGLDGDDCVFTATHVLNGVGQTASSNGGPHGGGLCVQSGQPAGPATQLLICQNITSQGTYGVGGDYANASLTSIFGTGNFFGGSSSLDGAAAGTGKGSAAVNGPVPILYGRVERAFDSVAAVDYGSGFLCNAGGPAISITDVAGVNIVLRFRHVNVSDQGYLCLRMPFQTTYDGFVWREACFPVREDGNSDLASALDPDNPTVEFPLDELPGCAVAAAPTLGAWSLIVLAVGLLAAGTWLLRRRRSFAELVPTP